MRSARVFALLLMLSATVAVLALALGARPMDVTQIRAGLADPMSKDGIILWSLRLPRSLVAFCAGAGLAVSGHLMQVLMRNPLASPDLTGATSGAIAVIVPLFIYAPWVSSLSYPVFGAAGALAAAGVTLAVSKGGRASPFHLALAGFSVSLLLSGITSFLLLRGGPPSPSVLFWLAGGFQGRSWAHLWAMLPWVATGIAAAFVLGRVTSLLMLGDAAAASMGVNVARWRLILLIVAVLPVAGVVPVAGAVGFIGLAVPHLVRMLRPEGPFWAVALNVAAGGLLAIIADAVARSMAAPREVPVGVMTALLGGVLILWLIRKGRIGVDI